MKNPSKYLFLCCLQILVIFLGYKYFSFITGGFTLFKGLKQYTLKAKNCTSLGIGELASNFHVPEVNCAKLFRGDEDEIKFSVNLTKSMNNKMLSDDVYLNLTQDCEEFKIKRGYVTRPVSSEEESFPIAFSLLVYKDIEMVERLLRAIYRPQNYYCIHVDMKAKPAFYNATSAIAHCLDNVVLTPERINVTWAMFSVLEPELLCMELLWRYKKWKYFINLTGQEFPLKTNWELVQILKAFKGANSIDSTIRKANRDRWTSAPPHNITPVKGSVHIASNRDFVDYILHNQTARDLLNWVKTTPFSDETFFATLNHNPQLGIKGTYKGIPETDPPTSMVKPFLTRFKNWSTYPCAGKIVRQICILSTGDLPLLAQARHMFANKFYLWEDRIAVSCLEEMIFNRTRAEIMGYSSFNATYYGLLGFVRDQVT